MYYYPLHLNTRTHKNSAIKITEHSSCVLSLVMKSDVWLHIFIFIHHTGRTAKLKQTQLKRKKKEKDLN